MTTSKQKSQDETPGESGSDGSPRFSCDHSIITYLILQHTYLTLAALLRYTLNLNAELLLAGWIGACGVTLFRVWRSKPSRLGRWAARNWVKSITLAVASTVFLLAVVMDTLDTTGNLGPADVVIKSVLWPYAVAICGLLSCYFVLQVLAAICSARVPLLVKILLLGSVAIVATHAYHDEYAEHNCNLDLHTESIAPEMNEIVQATLARSIKTIVETGAHVELMTDLPHLGLRAVHPKAHGCVRGEFTVDSAIKPQYQVGAFQQGASYPAWVRFSNAAHAPASDDKADTRGMAVKLMQVPGTKVLETDSFLAAHNMTGLVERHTQDILTITSDFFPVAEPLAYNEFVRALGAPSPGPMLKFIFPGINPLGWRLKFFYLAIRSGTNGLIANPLAKQYFSATPYRLGAFSIKYSWAPCGVSVRRRQLDLESQQGDDFLREAMRRQLDPNTPAFEDELPGACFELLVQEQRDACREPVEDPTRPWRGPWSRIGVLRIPKQAFLHQDQLQFCRDLSFSPWHTLPEHQPMGAINLLRKGAYKLGATTRNLLNTGGVGKEPIGNENFSQPQAESGDP